jgi:uncharacterized protein YndB with AHSA1/START domain
VTFRRMTATVALAMTDDPAPLELTVSRLIDAPVPLVFRAWTSQEHAARWWGPRGFTVISCQLDARQGGGYRVAMRSPEGKVVTKRGVYRAVIPPELLAFSYAWEEPDGSLGHEMRVEVTFAARGPRTLLTLRQTGFETIAARDSHLGGWTSCLERFAEFAVGLATDVRNGPLSPRGG